MEGEVGGLHVDKVKGELCVYSVKNDGGFYDSKLGEISTSSKFLQKHGNELKILRICHGIPNIIRISTCANDKSVLVCEEFKYTLETFLKVGCREEDVPILLKLMIKISRDILQGVSDMHRLGICHVNLYPPSIAMVKVNTPEKFIAKLCNFSMARQLKGNELATNKRNDILNAASAILFCFTKLEVAGDKLMSVVENVGRLKKLYEKTWKNEVGFRELHDFICLLKRKGVTAQMAMSRPMFWSTFKKERFLHAAHDYSKAHIVNFGIIKDWKEKVPSILWVDEKNDKEAFDHSVRGLLKFIRDNTAHYATWDPKLQSDCTVESVLEDILICCPDLLMQVYKFLEKKSDFYEDPKYSCYFS